jgi:hypothetical protein
VPDEVPRKHAGRFGHDAKPQYVDAADELVLFVTHCPAWVSKDGLPRSWQHFVVGLQHISRQRSRDTLDQFRAVGAAFGGQSPERDAWINEQSAHAGWG